MSPILAEQALLETVDLVLECHEPLVDLLRETMTEGEIADLLDELVTNVIDVYWSVYGEATP